MAMVDFKAPDYDFDDREVEKDDFSDVILWSADHREAMVQLDTNYGPLDGTGYLITLRKSGNTWYVIRMKMTWVS